MFKYTYSFLYGLATLVFSYLAFAVTGLVAFWVWEALIEWFPSVFPDYSPILDAREYNRATHTVSVIGTVLAIFITSLIVTRLDNGRDELIIKKTEGFYRIPEIMPFYYKTYALADLVSSLINTAIIAGLIIPSYLISTDEVNAFTNAVKGFRSFHIGTLYNGEDPVIFVISVFLIFYISKLIAGIHGLKRWRSSWLSFNY